MSARREKLLAAAHQASVATEVLLRVASEGGEVDEDTLEKLADAAKILIEADVMAEDAAGETGQLHAALSKFLEGWAS
ncbi:hypothetical protein GTW51_10110 [Aurantimonas aggregata]|uniref:Uncharacterized protein n=1 Tax=Aurantimonas aggregata TaxID=2047720 RepID=A0A6L9MGV2_9HYPH|nr:hypothetical protein [Aurantimonas aggregata]NDV87055.1 hypothetical protein [Aurantimonas aggregata]